MGHLKLILVMLFAGTSLYATSSDSYYRIEGIWTDRYHDQRLEIRNGYDGIEVRKKGLFRKTRRFYQVRHNHFSDNNGNTIKIVSSSKLVWKNRRNRTHEVFYRPNNRNRYGNQYDNRYSRNRNLGHRNNQNNRNYRTGNLNNNYYGSWYSFDGNRNIVLESHGSGFKVKRRGGNGWKFYERDRYESNVFRSSLGDSYYFKDDYMIWNGKDGYQSIRFRRR
jgi:hypothetical protein